MSTLRWPLPALFAWLTAWLLNLALRWQGLLPDLLAWLFATLWGLFLMRYGATPMTASAALRGGSGRRKHDPERPFGARPIPVTQAAIEDSWITVLPRTSGKSRAGPQFFEAPRDSYGRLAACATIYTFRYGRLFVTSLSIPVSLSRHRAASLCFADRSETRASILSDEKGGFGQK